jgi:hypothetical protein
MNYILFSKFNTLELVPEAILENWSYGVESYLGLFNLVRGRLGEFCLLVPSLKPHIAFLNGPK